MIRHHASSLVNSLRESHESVTFSRPFVHVISSAKQASISKSLPCSQLKGNASPLTSDLPRTHIRFVVKNSHQRQDITGVNLILSTNVKDPEKMDQIAAELRKIPPMTRFICGSTMAITLPVIMKMVHPYKIVYISPQIFKKLQVWRLYTSFFLGSSNINFIFEMVMLYRMTNQLESGPYLCRSSDLAWQLFFACTSIAVATRPLNSFVFLRPMIASLSYLTSSLAPPGSQTSIMGLVTVPIKYFPYVMVLMDLFMSGPGAAAESVAGLVVGHMWWWTIWGGQLGSRGLLESYGQAPRWLKNLFGEGNEPRAPTGGAGGAAAGLQAAGVEVIAPRRAAADASGHPWGQGRRLGT